MPDTLYKTLGVSKNAAKEDIKKSYRKLIKELHPDLNPGNAKAEERFKRVSAAYDILGDETKRGRYDAGEINGDGAEQHPQHRQGQNPYQGSGGYQDMGDMFSQMFRGQQRGGYGAQPFKGQDRRFQMKVGFLEAALGSKKQITMGDGALLNVSIPKGLESSKSIRLKGKGEQGVNGGPNGDALIQVEVENHPYFTRSGLDIELDLPLTIYEAALGGKVSVPTIKGNVGLNIPAGSSSGKVLRLKGRGIETARKKGDQLVKLSLQLPTEPSDTLAEFLEGWKKDNKYSPRDGFS